MEHAVPMRSAAAPRAIQSLISTTARGAGGGRETAKGRNPQPNLLVRKRNSPPGNTQCWACPCDMQASVYASPRVP